VKYSFGVEHAKRFGVDEAIILQNLMFWITQNKKNESNQHEGKTWTYNSASAYAKRFPFWSERKISRIIKSLEVQGAIMSGCFNSKAYDRTKWYALVDENSYVKSDESNGQKRPMEPSLLTNGTVNSDRPIPDINTDQNTDQNKRERKPRSQSDDKLNASVEKARALFRMKPATKLDKSQLTAVKGANDALLGLSHCDWKSLEAFYAAPQSETYSRRTLATFLNNINGELSKAQDWAETSKGTKIRYINGKF
jgi:hypothetical protein